MMKENWVYCRGDIYCANLVKKKVFHSVRIGGSIRISKKSFDEWLDHQM